MKQLFILLLAFNITISVKAQTPKNIGHRFYVKMEVLNSLKTVIESKSYDIDVQLTYRINNDIHLVGTYGKTTFYLNEDIESILSPNRFKNIERIGTAFNRSSIMVRYYPFYDYGKILDFAFIEGGFYFMDYVGVTNNLIYQDNIDNVVEQNRRDLEFYRYGPQLNIGLSKRYEKNKKTVFSPEFFIGISYNHLDITKDETTFLVGASTPIESYSEFKIGFNLRAKIGIGFL
jgi:hypothetical protein